MKKIIFILSLILSIIFIGCEKDKSTIDKITDGINEKIDNASKAAKDGIKKAGIAAEKTLDNASKDIENGLKKANENIDKAKKEISNVLNN